MLPQLPGSHQFAQQNINDTIPPDHNVMLNNSDITSTDELVMVLTDHDYNDSHNDILTNNNSNIVVLYSHPVSGQPSQYITSESNLLLNSETGMIEIRNNSPIGVDAQHDGQIESIEMIQHEINRHNMVASQEREVSDQNLDEITTELPSAVAHGDLMVESESIQSEHPAIEEHVQDSGEDSVKTVLDGDAGEEHLKEDIMQNDGSDSQYVAEEEITDVIVEANEPEENVSEEPMEIDEECHRFSGEDQNFVSNF